MSNLALFAALSEKVIAVNPLYIKITGGSDTAILLSQLIYWAKQHSFEEFYNTTEDLSLQTFLSERQIKYSKKKLQEQGFITVTIRGMPAKSYYQVNIDKIMESLKNTVFLPVGQKRTNKKDKNVPTSWYVFVPSITSTKITNKNNNTDGDIQNINSELGTQIREETHLVDLQELGVDITLWNAFEKLRKEKRDTLTTTSRQYIINKLKRLKMEGNSPNEIIQQTLENGWTGLFPIKQGKYSINSWKNKKIYKNIITKFQEKGQSKEQFDRMCDESEANNKNLSYKRVYLQQKETKAENITPYKNLLNAFTPDYYTA